MEKGRKESLKKVALNLLDILDDTTIAEKTGLSLEEIRRLKEGKGTE